jgi:hypothetical protein
MRVLSCCFALIAGCCAQDRFSSSADSHCPRYPEALRSKWSAALEQQYAYRDARIQRGRSRSGSRTAVSVNIPRNNLIDNFLFDKMSADGVNPAPLTTDSEFLRRAYLDLTGRIPQPEQVVAFLSDGTSDKRSRLIDQLLASDAYISQFTLYFNNQFQITRGYPSNVRVVGRNLFHNFLRDFVAKDRPYDQFVRELLAAAGDADTVPGVNYFVRYVSQEEFNPVLRKNSIDAHAAISSEYS